MVSEMVLYLDLKEHNMATHFGSLPYNFYQDITTGAGNVIDGNRSTFWNGSTLVMPLGTVRMTPSSVTINSMFMSCQNVTGYTLTNMSGTVLSASSTAPTNINGGVASLNERQYLYVTFSSISDSQVTLTVTGSNTAIYEVYIFNSVFSLDRLTEVRDAKVNQQQGIDMRGSVIYEALDGTLTKTPPLNSGKFTATYTFQFGGTEFNDRIYKLYDFLIQNPMFTHAVDTEVYPERVYRAVLTSEVSLTQLGRFLKAGERSGFSITER